MKCIKSTKQTKQVNLGEIIRTTDEDAIEKVKGGNWIYVSKMEWKSLKSTPKVDKKEIEEEPKVKKGKNKKELKLEKKSNK
jgi:hypothetical protein